MKMIHAALARLPNSAAIARRFSPRWSGILVLDGKYVRVQAPRSFRRDGNVRFRDLMCWISGIDSGTGDLPHYMLADEEGVIDLVLYFQALKKIGYPLRVLVCDGNTDFIRAGRRVYGDTFLVQLCTRHFVEGLQRKSVEAGAGEDARTQELVLSIQRVIEATSIEESLNYLSILKQKRFYLPIQKLLIDDFKKHADYLTTHLQHDLLTIPHTTNDAENVFHQLGLRLESLGQFMHWKFAEQYLNGWTLLRRFTPYTDCKGERKKRNGKAPLECAGCEITGVDIFKIDG